MSSRGGRRRGGGRRPLSVEVHLAIIGECSRVRSVLKRANQRKVWQQYFKKFPNKKEVDRLRAEMGAWTLQQRMRALSESEHIDPADIRRQEILEDVRAYLDSDEGAQRSLRGLHQIFVPRLSGYRAAMFKIVARRLTKRLNKRITRHTVERIWKSWEGRKHIGEKT